MRCFVVTVPLAHLELASDRLWQLGVRGIEERAVGDRVELWTAVGEDRDSIERAVSELDPSWEHRFEAPAETADTWREFAAPMRIDRDLLVLPAWQEAPSDLDPNVTVVTIEPGAAFGLGDHPTTSLSLRALRAALDEVPAAGSVLDVGCGTGLLAVAAAATGIEDVRAIDVSSAAVEATLDNARRNHVSDRLRVDASPLASIEGSFDVVVANILAPTLIELAGDLVRVTGHTLVISGILADRHDHVLAALHPLVAVRTLELDGWVAVTLRFS